MADQRKCAIEGCRNKNSKITRGWCASHYLRWRTHGDPLGGRTARGELERYYREVVLTDERGVDAPCLIWPYQTSTAGYGCMGGDPTVIVSRRLCEDVNGPPPTPDHEAAHSCNRGQHGCVTQSHLSWKTHIENMADQVIHGTRLRGERQNGAKLTEPEVHEIRALKGKMLQREIAEQFGVDPSQISNILRGRHWSWLQESAL